MFKALKSPTTTGLLLHSTLVTGGVHFTWPPAYWTYLTQRWAARRWMLGAAVALAAWAGVVVYGAQFFMAKTVPLSYSSTSCFFNPVFFPKTTGQTYNDIYQLKLEPKLQIHGYPLFSATTCVTPKAAPKQDSSEKLALSALHLPFLKKPVTITSGQFPKATSQLKQNGKISAKGALVFDLSKADTMFDYQAVLGTTRGNCTNQAAKVTCDLTPLNLAQAQSYTVSLERTFHGTSAGVVTRQQLTSIEPEAVTATSISANANVFTVPTDILLTLSKPALKTTGVKLEQISGNSRTSLPFTTEISGAALRIILSVPLPRSASIELTVGDIEGTDHSFLNQPFVLPFKTTGGPVAGGINIGTYKVARAASFTVTFDVGLDPHQAAAAFAAVTAGGQNVPVTATISGRTLTITPTATLPACAPFTVKILPGLTSEYGVGGGQAWSYTSRTICQTVFSIGSSVQGRALTAYKFGTGASVEIFVGNLHGNEKSSATLLSQWVDALEAGAPKIPAGRTIIVIPSANPDGNAANTRTNAHNVDLNRNFPANDWKMSVTMPDKSLNPTGGGSSPLSEPESAALAAFVISQSPRLVLTYHAAAGVVMPNDSGDSQAVAHLYDQKSNLYFASNDQTGAIFAYDTTGSFETWLHDKQNIPTILVELWTMAGNEYTKNESALWAMASL